MRVAALTMAYNEPVWAPVWARYYASQVGAAHCFLFDHGSDDGSTEGLGINVERLRRSPLDEIARAALISDRAAELLRSFDAVVHSDVDELVLADPAQHSDLVSFARDCPEAVVTAAGLDLQHLVGREHPLDPARPLGDQRRWVRFSESMCKPAFVRRPVRWQPGFHSCDAPMQVGGLFLIHLRYADLALGLKRLARTRALVRAQPEWSGHQRVSDQEFSAMMAAIAALPTECVELEFGREPLRCWLARVKAGRDDGTATLSLAGDRLWELPERMRRLF